MRLRIAGLHSTGLRISCFTLLTLLVCLLCATAFASTQGGPASQVQITAPLARHADAPSPDATAEELERKGDQLRGNKDFLDALDYLRAAAAKNPNNPKLLNKIGIVQLQLAHYGEARKSFEAAIRMNRGYADAHNNLGVDYYLQESAKLTAKLRAGAQPSSWTSGDFGRAVREYRKAIKLQEDSASFYSNLGTAYFAKKDFAKAVESYTHALALDPDVFEHTSRVGVAAQTSSPGDRAEYFYLLARMYAKSGATDRSLSYLRRAMEDGYKDFSKILKDEEFAAVRNDPRFSALINHKPIAITE
jgi:tetratricopeptide (TPR) repeat protein